jgi:hypothetical protein
MAFMSGFAKANSGSMITRNNPHCAKVANAPSFQLGHWKILNPEGMGSILPAFHFGRIMMLGLDSGTVEATA